MIKKYLFYVVFIATGVILVLFSFNRKSRNYAIVAEVEPQKTAISYHKPVRIKSLYVQPGAHVKKGDLLLEVERPDLELDVQKVNNELAQLLAEREKREEDFQSIQKVEAYKHRQQIESLDARIRELETSYRSDSAFYAEVTNWAGADSLADNNVHFTKLQSLRTERDLEMQRYASERSRQKALFTRDMEQFELRHVRLADEAASLKLEKDGLKQYAPFDGTIGSVSVQLMELIPPYRTIISVYDESPNIIRAFMNEQDVMPVSVGQKVSVESTNRQYAIEGELIEIGSRIVSYPKQMISGEQIQMWGKELFVQIPDDNSFLNGEKVYVVIPAN